MQSFNNYRFSIFKELAHTILLRKYRTNLSTQNKTVSKGRKDQRGAHNNETRWGSWSRCKSLCDERTEEEESRGIATERSCANKESASSCEYGSLAFGFCFGFVRWNTSNNSSKRRPGGTVELIAQFGVYPFRRIHRAKEVIGLCAKAALLPATPPTTRHFIPSVPRIRAKI